MGRAWWTAVAVVAGALALATLGAAGQLADAEKPVLQVTFGVLIGALFVAAGLVVRRRGSRNRMGVLLIIAGYAWLAEDLVTSHLPAVYAVGLLLKQASVGPLVHVVLAHPDGRLTSRVSRAAVAVGYGVSLGLNAAIQLTTDSTAPPCATCRADPFVLVDAPALRHGLEQAVLVGYLAVIGLTGLGMVLRWRRGPVAARPVLLRVYGPALAMGAFGLVDTVVRIALGPYVPAAVAAAGNGFTRLALLALPAGVIAGVLRDEAARTAAAGIADALHGAPRLDRLRDALAAALGDPELVLAVPDPASGRFVDGHGAPAGPAGAHRVASEVRDGERTVALILHDAALQREPAALAAAAAVVRGALASAPAPGGELAQLSAREREVLALMASGLSNRSIAGRLVLSERTVESHVTSIFRKLRLSSGARENRRVLAVLAFLGTRAD